MKCPISRIGSHLDNSMLEVQDKVGGSVQSDKDQRCEEGVTSVASAG